MEIINMKVSDLIPYEKNAKKHPDEQIKQIIKSIEQFGFNDPIAVDENNVVIEGHGRLIACKKLKIKEVPVIVLSHLTEKQKKAYILAHNKLTLNSDFDIEMLNLELSDILDLNLGDEFDIKMEDFGFQTSKGFDVMNYLCDGGFSETLTKNSNEFSITFTLPLDLKEKVTASKNEIKLYILENYKGE